MSTDDSAGLPELPDLLSAVVPGEPAVEPSPLVPYVLAGAPALFESVD
jgi:hypothetical protein